jgi:membrane protein implicated in regulation of membrane protease activity
VSGFIASNETVMLTVVDALGTVVANTTTLTIERPAVGVALRSPQTNGSTEAGSPLALSIVAVDASGSVVDGFAGAVTLALSSGCGPTWVNDSAGPVNGTSGTYALGAAAWSRVGLNVTVTPTEVGTCGVAATTPAFSAGTALAFPVDADAGHLHLVRPEVVRSHPGDNATLYTVLDRFGNPDPSGFLIVETRFGATLTEVDSAIRVGPGGAALVWVNYSSPGPGGTLTVLGESGVAVLGPIAIPGLPASSAVPTWAWFGLGALLAVVSVVAVVRFRRRGAAAVEETPRDPDEPLRRLAEGRAHVLARLREHDGADLDTIAAGFPGPPPDAAELAEWVGTLVTEGLVEPSVGTDGRPRFLLTNPEPAPSPPRVEVDTAALDAALAQRDRDAADEAAPPP